MSMHQVRQGNLPFDCQGNTFEGGVAHLRWPRHGLDHAVPVRDPLG
jgi:hypothetical protein